jgi:hypothetical protein
MIKDFPEKLTKSTTDIAKTPAGDGLLNHQGHGRRHCQWSALKRATPQDSCQRFVPLQRRNT